MQKRPMLEETKRNKYPKKKMKIHQIVYLQIWTKSTKILYENVSKLSRYTYTYFFSFDF